MTQTSGPRRLALSLVTMADLGGRELSAGCPPCGAFLQEALDVGREGASEQKSLGQLAFLTLKLFDLAAVLDPLGERRQAERLAELDQRVRQRVPLA